MITLKRVCINGFTSIAALAGLELNRLTVLVGANGAGKSNFLTFFHMLNYMMSGSLQTFIGRFGGANSLLYLGAKRTHICDGRIEFDTEQGRNIYEFSFAHARPDTLIFTDETISLQRAGEPVRAEPIVLGAGHKESALLEPLNWERGICRFFRETLTRFRFFHFHDTSATPPLRSRTRTGATRFLNAHGGNLPAILLYLRDRYPSDYAMVVKTVRLVAPFFEDFVLEPEPG